jgi:hypothetical protein
MGEHHTDGIRRDRELLGKPPVAGVVEETIQNLTPAPR